MHNFSRSELDIMYARAKVKLDAKLRRLADVDGITVSDFGTRRRHGHLWQEHCILTANEILGDKFVGTKSEEHTSELQSLMRISYAVFCLKKKNEIQLSYEPNSDHT